MDPDAITYFGQTDARNKKIKFGIKAKDRLRHMYIIGKTGMGKSTLLENLAIQDIQNGNGMAFIDPHGGTAEKLLDYVPESRIKDVLYFAPFDMEYPIAFNVMEDIGADKRHLVVNGLMSTFEKIWVDAWSARMAYILSNTLLALLEYPGATLLGVNRMLSDKEYRRKVVENIKDTSVKAFWVDEFGKWTEKFVAEAIPAIQNKVGQFTSNPLVRNLLGQSESTFNIRTIMDEKKILIINLSKGRVGEGNANLLGSMLITKIYLAAMSRADKDEAQLAKLPNFYLYVDEFQSFANKSFADILSEARKYKLSLNIAHQYIEQMEEEVRDAVFGNVGTMISFRVGAFDSEVLEKEFAPTFMAVDLVNLGFTQIYLKLMINSVSSQPFSATVMTPIPRPEKMFTAEVIKSSRDQFARPRAEVEKSIVDWHDIGTSREVRPQFAPPPQRNDQMPPRSDFRPRNDYQPNPTPRPQERPMDRPIERERRPESSRPSASQSSNAYRDTPPPSYQGNTQNNAQGNSHNNSTAEQTKLAFMKAAEELRARAPQPPQQVAPEQKRETVSLSDLQKEKDKKNPTNENISSLKSALAGVINKPKVEEKKHEPVKVQEVKSEQPKEQIPKKVEPQPQQQPKPEPQPEQRQESKPADKIIPQATKEVPEDVLRDLLK